jgi:molecular chaperone GrpE (heat shock protein)
MTDHADPNVSAPRGTVDQVLEELAEDMLAVLERMSRLEEGQLRSSRSAEELSAAVASANRAVDAIRRDLLSDRKALAIKSVVAQVAPALESLSCMREGIDSDADPRVRSQFHSITAILENLLLGMGLQSFTPQAGDLFDANRMESAGYAEGPQGTVIQPVHHGYMAGQIIIRPATVLIGNISGTSTESSDSTSEEA